MDILLVLGPLRAGKTTLIQALSRAMAASRHFGNNEVVLVQNDVAFSDGAGNLDPLVTHIGMAAGCFGCQDSTQLVAKLHELRDNGYKLCILEPFGFVSGEQMLNVLLKTGMPFKVMTLVHGNFPHEPQVRTTCVRSQLRYADAMVVTHQSLTQEARSLITETLPEAQFVFRKSSATDLRKILEWVMEDTYSTKPNNLDLLQSMDGEHEHPVCEVIFLPTGFTEDNLAAALKTLETQGLMRVKGSLGGKTFHVSELDDPANLTWEAQTNPQPNVLVIYAEEGYILSHAVSWLRGSVTRENLRNSGDMSPDKLNDALSDAIAEVDLLWSYPASYPRLADGTFLVYSEAFEWINELRKDPQADPQLVRQAINQRVRIAQFGLQQAENSPELFPADSLNCERLAHYAVTVCWFLAEKTELCSPLRDHELETVASGLVKGLPHLVLGADVAVSTTIRGELAITVKFLLDRLTGELHRELFTANQAFLDRHQARSA